MAKGKHAVALFEVIQSSKASRKGISLRTPKWWFKGKGVNGSGADKSASPAPLSTPPLADQRSERPPASTVVVEPEISASVPAPRASGIDLRLDPDRQRISFQFTYTSAIVTIFSVLVLVGLAYIIGRHVAMGPSAALAGPSTDEIRKGPVKSGVLDVKSGSDLLRSGTGNGRPSGASNPQQQRSGMAGVDADDAIRAMPAQPRSGSNSAATQPAGRVIGLNYVVVQIYPEEKTAQEAKDLLAKNGIASTIEKGLPGYAANNWYCVVGMTGFDRIRNNPKFEDYERSIRSLSDRITKDQRFKRFDPQAYRWKGN